MPRLWMAATFSSLVEAAKRCFQKPPAKFLSSPSEELWVHPLRAAQLRSLLVVVALSVPGRVRICSRMYCAFFSSASLLLSASEKRALERRMSSINSFAMCVPGELLSGLVVFDLSGEVWLLVGTGGVLSGGVTSVVLSRPLLRLMVSGTGAKEVLVGVRCGQVINDVAAES